MIQNQHTKYTYFCHANNTYTWIDHIICEKRDVPNISSCCIKPEESGNTSDHLPVQLKFSVNVNEISKQNENVNKSGMGNIKPNWSNNKKVEMYSNIVLGKISNILPIDVNNICFNNIKYELDQRISQINNTIISATKESGCIPVKFLKAKTYWCPELSQLRDKKRFWWSV